MPQITIIVFFFLFSWVHSQTIKIESVTENEVEYSILNDTNGDIELTLDKGQLVFLEVELWGYDLGCRLVTKFAKEISDGGAFVLLDSSILQKGNLKRYKINIESFKSQSDEGEKLLKFFLERNKGEPYEIRLILSSLKKKIFSDVATL